MQLPVREQQLQPAPVEQVQPIQQMYDTAGAQAEAQSGQAISNLGEMVQKRADQLNEQYRNSVINQRTLNYSEQESQIRNQLLARKGFNAQGIVTEYAQAHKDLEEQALQDISNPEDKRALQFRIEQNRIQGEDQLATSTIANVRQAQSELVQANNNADKIAFYQYPTNDNLKTRMQSISDRILADHKANGKPVEDANVMIDLAGKEMLSGAVQNFIDTNDYDSARKMVSDNAGILGGADSLQTKDLLTKIDNLIVDKNSNQIGYNLATKFHKYANGLEAAVSHIQSMNLTSDQQRVVMRSTISYWDTIDKEIATYTESRFAPIYDHMADYEMQMFKNSHIDPNSLYNAVMPEINKMATDDRIDPKKLVNLKTTLNSIVERGIKRNEAIATLAESRALRAQNLQIHSEEKAEKEAIQLDQDSAVDTLVNNRGSVHSLYDLFNKFPKAGIPFLKNISGPFDVPNTWSNAPTSPPPGDKDLTNKINSILSPWKPGTPERTDAFGQMAQWVATKKAEFIQKNGYKPLPSQQIDFWLQAAKNVVTSKGPKGKIFGIKPVSVEFEGKQVYVDPYGIPRVERVIPKSNESDLMNTGDNVDVDEALEGSGAR